MTTSVNSYQNQPIQYIPPKKSNASRNFAIATAVFNAGATSLLVNNKISNSVINHFCPKNSKAVACKAAIIAVATLLGSAFGALNGKIYSALTFEDRQEQAIKEHNQKLNINT